MILEQLIGMEEEQARLLAEHYNYRVRTTCVDGQYGFVTADYREDRINLTVEDGKVKKVEIG